MKITINIDENVKCKQCGKGGAIAESGICLECVNKNLKSGKYNHIIKKNKPKDYNDK